MATYNNNPTSYHPTLSGTTVDTVTLTQTWDYLEITNRAPAGGADLWVTFTKGASDPVAAAAGTDRVGAGETVLFSCPGDRTVKVLGAGNAYSVVGISDGVGD